MLSKTVRFPGPLGIAADASRLRHLVVFHATVPSTRTSWTVWDGLEPSSTTSGACFWSSTTMISPSLRRWVEESAQGRPSRSTTAHITRVKAQARVSRV